LMFWNVTFIYNAFIRTTDHCKVQTAFVSLFYSFINMKPWNASYSSVVVERPRPLGHLTNFLRIFTNFFNFGKFVKIREFVIYDPNRDISRGGGVVVQFRSKNLLENIVDRRRPRNSWVQETSFRRQRPQRHLRLKCEVRCEVRLLVPCDGVALVPCGRCTIKTAADWNGRRPIRPRDKTGA